MNDKPAHIFSLLPAQKHKCKHSVKWRLLKEKEGPPS